MNNLVIIIVVVLSVIVIAWLVWKNMKDEKKLEQQLNDDYPKPKEHKEDDSEGGEPSK